MNPGARGNLAHQVPIHHKCESARELTSGHRFRSLLQQLTGGCHICARLIVTPELCLLGFVLEGNSKATQRVAVLTRVCKTKLLAGTDMQR